MCVIPKTRKKQKDFDNDSLFPIFSGKGPKRSGFREKLIKSWCFSCKFQK